MILTTNENYIILCNCKIEFEENTFLQVLQRLAAFVRKSTRVL